MSGILYLLSLIAVPWLVAWTIRDPDRPTEIWWPFDMKGDEAPEVRGRGTERARRPHRPALPEPAAPWRERGGGDRNNPRG